MNRSIRNPYWYLWLKESWKSVADDVMLIAHVFGCCMGTSPGQQARQPALVAEVGHVVWGFPPCWAKVSRFLCFSFPLSHWAVRKIRLGTEDVVPYCNPCFPIPSLSEGLPHFSFASSTTIKRRSFVSKKSKRVGGGGTERKWWEGRKGKRWEQTQQYVPIRRFNNLF